MAQNLYVDAARTLGQYGSTVDVARIKAEQERERQINDMTARAAGIMTTEIRIKAEDAKRLKNDTAFTQFVEDVRNEQIRLFTTSDAQDVEQREEAHAILRALNKIEVELDAAIMAETLLDRKQ